MTIPQKASLGTRHFDELDSLRGLAAITVALGHIAGITFDSSTWPGHPLMLQSRHLMMALNRTPLAFLMEGGAAVRFFFVLSGFVLMLPFMRNKSIFYPTYIVKRVTRLYLPYLAAVALGLLGDYLLGQGTPRGFSTVKEGMWTTPITGHMIAEHIVMLGHHLGSVDEVLWSLVQEMRVSIIYPLIVLLVLNVNTSILLLVVAAIEATLAFLSLYIPVFDTGLTSFPATIHYATLFIFGAWLAYHHVRLGERLQRFTGLAKIAIAFVVFMCYSMGIKLLWGYQFESHVTAQFSRHFPHAWFSNVSLINFIVMVAGDWIAAISAGVAILYALNVASVKRFLHFYPVLIIGRASYTLYLVHALVLWTLFFGLFDTAYAWMILPGFVVGTILLTWAFYRVIEIPTRDLGRHLAKAMLAGKTGERTASISS